MPPKPTIALIVAGGKGTRFSSDTPKQYSKIDEIPILRHTIMAFLSVAEIEYIQVVINPNDLHLYQQATEGLALLPPILGGATRQDSVRNGLEALKDYHPHKILIHDAARPFISSELIKSIVAALDNVNAVIPTLPICDTVKQLDDTVITATLNREQLALAQTPQGFHYPDILSLHRRFSQHAVTDDAALFEQAAMPVHTIQGEERNIKITTMKDKAMQYETRIGSGFDAHRFKEPTNANPHVMLCGVPIPHTHTLEAHSDGDVALHALVDALLGTISAGDIGLHFPPSDPQWKNADSKQFVEHACMLVSEAGGRIVNADITIIGESPRIGAYRTHMTESVANMLKIDKNRVNIKATTTEKMGFTGRKEGIATQAVVSVEMARL